MGIAANKWITQVQIYRKEVSAVLYEFRVGNYLSYKDVQGIRMAPVLPREASEKGTKYGPVSNLMFLYGPNASGKSNIVKAIEFAKNVVYEGSSFKVDQFYEQNPIKIRPSYFEFVFDMSESGNYNVYSFGFEINASGRYFESEWLCNLSAKEDKFLYQISNEGADPKGEVLGLPIIFSRIDPNYSEFNISWNDQIIEDLEYNNNMFWPIQINQIDYPELKELESLCSNVRNYIYKSILIKIGNSSVDGIKFENFDEHSVYECNIKIKEFNEYLTSVKNILPAKMQVDFWDSSRDLFWENHTSDPDMLNLRIEGIFFKNDENAPKISIDAEKTSAELATDCDFAGGKAPIEYQSSGTFRMIYLITLLF